MIVQEFLKNSFFMLVSAGLAVFCVVLLVQNILLISSLGKIDGDFQRKTAVRLEEDKKTIRADFDTIYRKQMESFRDTADKLSAERKKSRGLEEDLKEVPRTPGEI
jgi:hypothetical protein